MGIMRLKNIINKIKMLLQSSTEDFIWQEKNILKLEDRSIEIK